MKLKRMTATATSKIDMLGIRRKSNHRSVAGVSMRIKLVHMLLKSVAEDFSELQSTPAVATDDNNH